MSYLSRIAGTGSYLPVELLTNAQLETMVDTNNEWILDRTGIATRHIAAKDEATSDLAYNAAIKAMEAAGITATQLDAILVGTITPDQVMPNAACMLQARLGCRQIMAMDLSAACSGFIYGACIADQFIRTGKFEHVLVIGAEILSRIVSYKDRGTCILFGDGAGAVVISRVKADSPSHILSAHLGANGALGDLLTLPGGGSRHPMSQEVLDKGLHHVVMKGREVFKSAVRAMCDRANEALETNNLKSEDVDWVIVHQANMRIIEAVSSQLGIGMEKVLVNIRETGNTSSASIPILFDESVRKGKIKRGQTVLFVAFGGGLTSASMLIKY
ncbi:MAG: beta-ketoacyl-ACP synthase III [Bdellovibrionales bacterium]